MSRTKWVKQRTQRITSKKSIRHEIQNLTVQINANLATVRFTQIYQDERLRASDRKTMHWVWRQGQWQITVKPRTEAVPQGDSVRIGCLSAQAKNRPDRTDKAKIRP